MGRLCFRTELNFLLLMQFLSGAKWRTFCLPIAIGIIPGYKVGGEHWRDHGISHYKSVLGAGVKAKSGRNDLPILSVLAERYFFSPSTGSYFKGFFFHNPSSQDDISDF